MDDLTRSRGADADVETGPPLRELAFLQIEPRPGFVERVRRGIQRRLLLADAVELGWRGLIETFVQCVRVSTTVGSSRDDARPQRDTGRRGRTTGGNRPVDRD